MTAAEYLLQAGKAALRPNQLSGWVRQGGDLAELVRLVWASTPEVRDHHLDLRLLADVSEERLHELGRLALEWFIAHPRDELSAEVLSQVSFQAPSIIHERLVDFVRALRHREGLLLSPMLLENVPEATLLEIAALCGGHDAAFILASRSGSEPATRLAFDRHFPDTAPQEREDAVLYALHASGVEPGETGGWLYPSEGFWLSTTADASGPVVECGGDLAVPCPVCQKPLRRLVTLAPPPDVLGVDGLRSLTLAACQPCLAFRSAEAWWLPHDGEGQPAPVRLKNKRRRAHVAPDIHVASRTVEARLTPIPERWRTPLPPASTRIGGPPQWIQDGEYPDCPRCGEVMTFLAQFAEDSPDGGGWMDALYVHWCDGCRVSHYLLQNS